MTDRLYFIKLGGLANSFNAVAVIGPRQSGKTTLVKKVFGSKPYISLENKDTREFALSDPRGFLASFPNGAVLDEVQKTPDLFSYLQEILDDSKKKGLFILTGSNNFLLQQNITQSLAGRIAYLRLLPLSIEELKSADLLPESDDELILKGFYLQVHFEGMDAAEWARNYIQSYVEKVVRQIKNIDNLQMFERFMALLAGRCS